MGIARRLILLMLAFGFSIGQTDYVTEFTNIENQYSGPDSITAVDNFFSQLSDTQRIDAVAAIAALGDDAYMFYKLFPFINDLFSNSIYQNYILSFIASNQTAHGFRRISIEALSNQHLDSTIISRYNSVLKSVSQSQNEQMNLRAYALSQYRGDPSETTYDFLEQMLRSNDLQLSQAAARCLSQYISSEELVNDRIRWIGPLTDVIDMHQQNLYDVKGAILLLGHIDTPEAQKYLRDLFTENVQVGENVSLVIARSLLTIPNTTKFESIINQLANAVNLFEDTYAIELFIGSISRDNPELINTLINGSSKNEKVAFLKAAQSLRNTSDQNLRSRIIDLLNDSDGDVRREAIKATRILFSAQAEETLFRPMLSKETDSRNRALLHFYIGRE